MHNKAVYSFVHRANQEQKMPASNTTNGEDAPKTAPRTEEKPKTGNLLSLLRDPEFQKQAEKYRDWT